MIARPNSVIDTSLIKFSSFQITNNIVNSREKVFKLHLDENETETETELTDNSLILDGKIAHFYSGLEIFSVTYCTCTNCIGVDGSDQTVLIFVGSSKSISVLCAEVCKEKGIKLLKETGCIIPPNEEEFKTMCTFGSVLSVATSKSIYFIDCQELHRNNFTFVLAFDENKNINSFIPEESNSITCHSWKGKHVALGTLSGRLHIFNLNRQEIFQTSICSESTIFSLDWQDEFTILIGGNFPKIYSIDLRDPFLIETEVSTLGK